MIYERVFNLMRERDVKPSDLSKAIGIRQSTISEWKQGRSNPSVKALISIADYFGVTVDYLVGHDTPNNTYKVKISKVMGKGQAYFVNRYLQGSELSAKSNQSLRARRHDTAEHNACGGGKRAALRQRDLQARRVIPRRLRQQAKRPAHLDGQAACGYGSRAWS